MRGIGYLMGILMGVLIWCLAGAAAADTTYQKVYAKVPVNYYVNLKSTISPQTGIYRSGGYFTSADNITPVMSAQRFAGREVHVTREEVTVDGTWVKFAYRHRVIGWLAKTTLSSAYLRLNVPVIAQRPQLPTGCEVVATAMMLQYAGAKVTKMQLAREMPRSHNPNKGFVGSPYSKSGWWIYPKGLMPLVKHHLGSAIDLTGAGFGKIKASIRQDHPVVVWVNGVDGFVNHALTVTGYSTKRVYYNDPWTVKRTSMPVTTLQRHRSHDGYRALSY